MEVFFCWKDALDMLLACIEPSHLAQLVGGLMEHCAARCMMTALGDEGAIASLGVDCGLLVRANQPCAEDLHAAGWPVAAGQTMADTCPRTCHVC